MILATTYQPTLFDLESRLANRSHTAVGALGERTAWLLFEKAGYRVSRPAGKRHGDLRVIDPLSGLVAYVEVKTARRSKDKKWRFTLIVQGKTDHRDADYVLLLAVLASGQAVPFLVPVDVLVNQRQAVITSDPLRYAGKLAAYRRANLRNFTIRGLPEKKALADPEGFDIMTTERDPVEKKGKPILLSITEPIPGWVRLRKIEKPDHTIDINHHNEMHQVIRRNLLRSDFWEEIPAEA